MLFTEIYQAGNFKDFVFPRYFLILDLHEVNTYTRRNVKSHRSRAAKWGEITEGVTFVIDVFKFVKNFLALFVVFFVCGKQNELKTSRLPTETALVEAARNDLQKRANTYSFSSRTRLNRRPLTSSISPAISLLSVHKGVQKWFTTATYIV